jgi:DNA (cytosine-5)-methyltransferase 1
MRIGSLFSGIGGLELGLEMAGLGETVWQVEQSAYCRSVLARHWPNARRFDDVRTVGAAQLASVDIICGGFPCQNLSHANVRSRTGLAGAQSGLWMEYARIVMELRPGFVLVENVYSAWRDWVPSVRSSLHGIGYASVPVRLSASDVGAPHKRERCFVIAYSYGHSKSVGAFHEKARELHQIANLGRRDWGAPPPGALGVDDGVLGSLDRLMAYGNAVVPQCAEVVGHVIRMLMEGA